MKLFDFNLFFKSIPAILSKLPITIGVSLFSFCLALILAFFIALIKMHKVRFASGLINIYVSYAKGVPLLVQLYLVTYGIPRTIYYFQVEHNRFKTIDSNLINPLYFAIFAFTVYIAAYMTESIRASIEAVGIGQLEAARSVGMGYWQAMRRIILPQAAKIALPVLGNSLINITKSTSFLYLVGVKEITAQARTIGFKVSSPFELHVLTAVIYWIICFGIERLFGYWEKILKRSIK